MRIVTLKSIRNVENINALAPEQTLSFCKEGMTIVYGENGSGKSGYVRILKAACRARRERAFDILPNVYVPDKGDPQTAVIKDTTYKTALVRGFASNLRAAAYVAARAD